MLNEHHIRRRFENAAAHFDEADFVHAETRQGLLQRIEPLLVNASTIVDLGAATGSAHAGLSKRFKGARIVAVDIAHNMLQQARRKKSWFAKSAYTQASARALPFADQSIDVVFANMLLPWLDDPTPVLTEVARVLQKGGMFAFATLGPDSLQEIRRAWSSVDAGHHVNRFPDMHDLGDGLVNAGLKDPVLDVDRLTISYADTRSVFADLTAAGARNSQQQRQATLTGKRRFDAMRAALEKPARGGKISLDLEIVYGHCWGAGPKNDPANYRISATDIPIRRN